MLNKFWKPVDEMKLVDGEVYPVNVKTFGLNEKDKPEYTKWKTHARIVDGFWREPVTGEHLEDTYNTVTHVLEKPDMLELQTHIHEQNVEKGWWKSPRCFSTMTNLFISENSEALEGDRKNLMDDKLPQYPMRVVELVDMCIRVFDYLGSVQVSPFSSRHALDNYRVGDFQFNLAMCTKQLTNAWFDKECLGSNTETYCHFLRNAIAIGFAMIRELGYDPIELCLEKHDFNAVRPDHKLENRTTGEPGAKAY